MEWLKKRINMRVLSVFLLVIAIPVIVYSAWNVRAVHVCVVRQQEIEQSRRMCEANSQNLANASDYLTEEVWRFVATGDTENLNNYWNEVDNIRNRDKAIKELETLKLTDEEMELVNIAKAESDLLIDGEAKSMRLVAESIGMKTEEMPPQVASVELTALESRMTAEEKRASAADYIFGAEYEAGKALITDSLNRFRRMLRSRKDEEVKAAMAETERALALAQSDNAAVLLMLAAALVSFYLLVMKPFLKYSVALRRADGASPVQLVPAGSAEVREFASVFNHVYSQWQEQNERLKELNAIDSLTGAANRETLYRYLEDLIGKKQGNIGVFMLDIDSFKSFNDAYGHLSGDEVLAKIGHFLNTIMAEVHGLASRVGGEEFALVVPEACAETIDHIAGKILYGIQELNLKHELLPLTDTHITVSLGSIFWKGGETKTPKELIHYADLALYQAKKNGKNQHVMFSETDYSFIVLQNSHTHDSEVEADMYGALERGEFIPYYQPQYDLKTERIVSAEVLVRWKHPKKGILYPDYFIPLFERNGFITKMDFCMFEAVCRDLSEWIRAGERVIKVACNFSRLHFAREDVAERLKEIADAYRVPYEYLEIEITESAFMDDSKNIIDQMKKLREIGFSTAIDDFGVGYSSLGLLQDVPADVLKIDRGFLNRDMADRKNVMIIKGIVNIANILHLKTVCEGVETGAQKELLKGIGCDLAQGYYYAKPMEREKMEALLFIQKELA